MADTDTEARRYHRRQLALTVTDLVLTAIVLIAWLWTGATRVVAEALRDWLGRRALVVAAMTLAVGGSSAALTFPLDVAAGFVLPRRAGLLAQSFRGWLGDKAKIAALGALLSLLAAEIVYGFLAWSPVWWWLASAGVLAAGAVLLAAVVPLWLVPLFYRLLPLEDPRLQARLLDLARRVGVVAAEVAVADFSRKGRTANAAVVGLGRTRRILVSDTLLASFPPEEVEIVLAHELAHHARGHMWQGLLLQTGLLTAVLALIDRALAAWTAPLGLAGPADPAGVPLLALLFAGLGLLTTPIAAAWSRRLEREADAIALRVTGDPRVFVSAMERLGQLNLAERRPNRLKELFATHPSLERRIAFARAAEARLASAS